VTLICFSQWEYLSGKKLAIWNQRFVSDRGSEFTKTIVAPASDEWVCSSMTAPRMEECNNGLGKCYMEIQGGRERKRNSEQWKSNL